MLLSFGIVFAVLAKYGFPVITQMVEERKTYIDQSMAVAREAMHERDKMIVEARRQAEVSARQELAEARRLIQQEKEEAIRDIRRQVAVLSVDIAEKVLRKNLSKEQEQMDMIDRMLDEVLAASRNKN